MSSATGRAREAVAWLKRRGSRRYREGMLRFGIVAPKAFGVSMGAIQQLGKRLGRDHELARALWKAEWYEARTLAAFVAEPERLTAAEMDRWTEGFDNWGVCDTLCFHLYDRSPHAWRKVTQWSRRREEFVRRAAFALLASLALHDRETGDKWFRSTLPVIERAAADDRNFVKKGVSWALRAVGRRSRALNVAAVAVARRLARASQPAARWVGKDALRELTSAPVRRRLR